MKRACFLDRDGVLIEEVNYLRTPDQAVLMPGAAKAVRLLRDNGFVPVVVSNQSGVARGYFSETDILPVESKIRELLQTQGAPIEHWYYCPHHPKGVAGDYTMDCTCRKPAPGMLLRAASEHDLDLSISAMIGDKFSDLEAAERAGCPIRILVRTGHGTDEIGSASPSSVEHLVADDILDAVKLLISSPDGPSPNPDSMESAE